MPCACEPWRSGRGPRPCPLPVLMSFRRQDVTVGAAGSVSLWWSRTRVPVRAGTLRGGLCRARQAHTTERIRAPFTTVSPRVSLPPAVWAPLPRTAAHGTRSSRNPAPR